MKLTAEDGTVIDVRVVPQTVPTTANAYHPSATHVDALGMPVAGVNADAEALRLIVAGNALAAEVEYDLEERGLILQTDAPYAALTADGREVLSDCWPYHPTPCCGAAASISDGPMYCKACYAEVDDAFGNVPVQPFRPIGG